MQPNVYSLPVNGDPDTGMQQGDLVPDAAFTTDDHSENVHACYASEGGSVTSGVWECAPCVLPIESYPVNEMMTIISGSMSVTDGEGNSRIYGPGDSLFVAKGAAADFVITEKLKKFFMTSA